MAGTGFTALNSLNIGMSVPGSESVDAILGESEEERKRRLALMSQQRNPGVAALNSIGAAIGGGMGGMSGGGVLSRFGL